MRVLVWTAVIVGALILLVIVLGSIVEWQNRRKLRTIPRLVTERNVQALVDLLRAPYGHISIAAAEGLAQLGPASVGAAPVLVAALLRPSGDAIVGPYSKALAAIQPRPETVPALWDALQSPDDELSANALYTISYIGRPMGDALPRILDVLHTRTTQRHRLAGAMALGEIGLVRAEVISYLGELLNGSDARLVDRAARAIASLGPAATEPHAARLASLAVRNAPMHSTDSAFVGGASEASQRALARMSRAAAVGGLLDCLESSLHERWARETTQLHKTLELLLLIGLDGATSLERYVKLATAVPFSTYLERQSEVIAETIAGLGSEGRVEIERLRTVRASEPAETMVLDTALKLLRGEHQFMNRPHTQRQYPEMRGLWMS